MSCSPCSKQVRDAFTNASICPGRLTKATLYGGILASRKPKQRTERAMPPLAKKNKDSLTTTCSILFQGPLLGCSKHLLLLLYTIFWPNVWNQTHLASQVCTTFLEVTLVCLISFQGGEDSCESPKWFPNHMPTQNQ